MAFDIHPHNGHGSVPSELENCPLCGQLLPNGAEATRIHAKLDADERARQRQREADRLAARSEGIAAAQPQITALNNQILDLKEGQDAAVNERVERERLAIMAKASGELSLKDAEITRLPQHVERLDLPHLAERLRPLIAMKACRAAARHGWQ